MKDITLSKTGGTARISILDGSDLPDVIALHESVRAALPDDKKRFLLPRGVAYFQNLLGRLTGLMIGIRADNVLVAQMAMAGPLTLREAIALQTISRGDNILYHHASLTDSVIVIKSLAAHPDWRGNDLGRNLLSFGLETPLAQVADHVFSQVAAGNRRSIGSFARQHFGIVAAAHASEDGAPCFVFQRPAFGFDFAPAIIADEADPVEDFSAISALTQREALVGVLDESSAGKIAFMRSRETLNLMPTLARVSVNGQG